MRYFLGPNFSCALTLGDDVQELRFGTKWILLWSCALGVVEQGR